MINDGLAYATLPAADYDRARQFWGERLGFEAEMESPAGTFYRTGEGSRFLVFPSGGKASGEHTQIGFHVSDIEKAVADLQSRGAIFEEYDMPGLKTENGIADMPNGRAAWFKDSEGNMIGVIQLTD